jgi:serine/threonine-protein kinase
MDAYWRSAYDARGHQPFFAVSCRRIETSAFGTTSEEPMKTDLEGDPPKLATFKYLVTSILGTGTNSTVMLVMDKRPGGAQLALKVIKREGPGDDAIIERARAECEASDKLNFPSILKVFDFRVRRNWLFQVTRAELLMEYVEGKPLDALAELTIGHSILIFHHVAQALGHMHRREVIHGDVRPSNVLVSRAGHVKVRGYGLSLVSAKLKDQLKLSGPYAAPEQSKEKSLDHKSDIYGLGAAMYHVLTHQPPGGNLVGRVEGKKISTPAALNPQVPVALNNLVVACLQSSPDRRPSDMYEVIQRLELLMKELNLKEAELVGLTAKEA